MYKYHLLISYLFLFSCYIFFCLRGLLVSVSSLFVGNWVMITLFFSDAKIRWYCYRVVAMRLKGIDENETKMLQKKSTHKECPYLI